MLVKQLWRIWVNTSDESINNQINHEHFSDLYYIDGFVQSCGFRLLAHWRYYSLATSHQYHVRDKLHCLGRCHPVSIHCNTDPVIHITLDYLLIQVLYQERTDDPAITYEYQWCTGHQYNTDPVIHITPDFLSAYTSIVPIENRWPSHNLWIPMMYWTPV